MLAIKGEPLRQFRVEVSEDAQVNFPRELLRRSEVFASQYYWFQGDIRRYRVLDLYRLVYEGIAPRIIVTLHIAVAKQHWKVVEQILDKIEAEGIVLEIVDE